VVPFDLDDPRDPVPEDGLTEAQCLTRLGSGRRVELRNGMTTI